MQGKVVKHINEGGSMNAEEILERLEAADDGELKELKLWLFKESIRLSNEKHELEMERRDFLNERENTREENRRYEEHLALKTKQLRNEEELIEQKHDIIKRGVEELDRDRQALKAREMLIRETEARLEESRSTLDSGEINDVLFRGADNILLIKKRYKDLMKMFHPDCLGGDTEMVKALNKTYDRLLRECDSYGKRRRA
jgi:DNA repair exonuclease SbcCD ATPase subunit